MRTSQLATAFLSLALLSAYILSVSNPAFANNDRQTFFVNEVFSDGKNGRPWRQWSQSIPERSVHSVEISFERTSGGNDTFINLRFGSGGAFEGGRQVLATGGKQNATINVNASPNGQPLVLNAYNGEVRVHRINVNYTGQSSAHTPRPEPRDTRPPRDRDDRFDDIRADDRDIEESCRRARRLRAPRIQVGEVKPSGGLFSGKYRVQGSMFGACVEEAGYFERGRLRQAIEFPLSDAYKRQEFEVRVESGKQGELRIYTMTGDEEVITVDELVTDSQSIFR